jgi:hypothetical protein
MRTTLRLLALLAGLVWAYLCCRALTGPESLAARDWRTAAFVLAFVLVSLGWQPKPPKKGSRYKERF